MQLDADEDGEPFFKPQAIVPAPIHSREDQGPPRQGGESGLGVGGGESQVEVAARATVEQEE